jgi:class 3 adenylate cyclase
MSMFHHEDGPRTRRLLALLRRRERAVPGQRREIDARSKVFRSQAVVFTDMADFTTRTVRDGIIHFLMVFDRFVAAARPAVERVGGETVKVEGDSLLLRFDDPAAALHGIDGIERARAVVNRNRPPNERLRISYGMGFGEIIDIEGDLFGLEVNLASKLGEDLAKPGEVLLTPAAAAALPPDLLARVHPYRVVAFGQTALPVQQYRLRRPAR